MRTNRLLALLSLAILSQACSPDEGGLLAPKKISGATPAPTDVGGGVGTDNSGTSATATPLPASTPAPVLQGLTIVPSSFTLSSDPLANFDERGKLLALIGTMSDGRQLSTTATWSASPTGRVTINPAGYVSVIANAPAGSVILTASSGSVTAQALALITTRTLTVSYVDLSPTSLSLYKPAANGTSLPEYPKQAQLNPSVVMSDLSTTSDVTWSVSDPSVATVSLTGLVSALGSGSCVIEAKSQADPLKKATCQLTVSAKGAVSVTVE